MPRYKGMKWFRRALGGLLILACASGCTRVPIADASSPTHRTLTQVQKSVKVRTDMWARMGQERAARGLPPLAWNGRLSERSAAWSKKMATTAGFVHSDLRPLLGPYDYVGENIGHGSPGSTGAALHVGFMKSQGHRDDILSPGFTSAGVGVFCGPHGGLWVTVEFGRKSSEGQGPAYNGGTALNPIVAAGGSSPHC